MRLVVGVRPAVVTRGATHLGIFEDRLPVGDLRRIETFLRRQVGNGVEPRESPWLCAGVGLSGIDMRFIMTSSMRLSHFARSPLQWNGARSLTCPCSGCVMR